MLTEDYIMRMINQALAVFLQALGLKKAGQYNQALQAFDQAVEGLLGLRAGLVDQLEDRPLLNLLTFRDKLDIERLLLLADIYHEKGELYRMQGQPILSKFSAQRSLRLYLEAVLAPVESLNLDLVQKIEAERSGMEAKDLPLETRLAMLDYFDRLQAAGMDFLETAGITPEKLKFAKDAVSEGMEDIL